MLTKRFERLFGNLLGAYVSYDDARSVNDGFERLAAAWLVLDDARTDIRREHDLIEATRRSGVRAAHLQKESEETSRAVFSVSHIAN